MKKSNPTKSNDTNNKSPANIKIKVSNNNKGNVSERNASEINYNKDEKYAEEKIINKVMKKGFESLTVEELAVTLISPTFENEYVTKTGNEWSKEYKLKANERLNFAKFNIQWNTKLNSSNPSNSKTPFSVLFDLVERGDIPRVTEYLRKNAQYHEEILYCVDKNKKSLLHVAAKCGHTNLTQVLLSKGFSIHMRDKFLRSPLHTACQNGKATVADILIKNGSDIYTRDSIGRTSLHYAACSDSIELNTLLLGMDPDLVYNKDTYGRTVMHYVVWNSNHNQLEIARKFLEAKAEVDALDEENMTPLHYAADAGKGKIIPLLLKYNANPFLRDGRTHRTALELALTENIREIIIVYSGKPYQVSKEDLNDLKINGEKVDIQEELKRGRQKSQPKKKLQIIHEENNVSQLENDNINEFLFKSQKEKLIGFLKNIQEYGVKSMQHVTKPALYSGSWLENVKNIDELFQAINSFTPTEAVLKIYNIISPYNSTFPQVKGEEENMAFFFNEGGNNFSNSNIKNFKNNNIEVKDELDKQNKILDSQRYEINDLKEEIKNLQKSITDNTNSPLVIDLKNQIVKYESENAILKINSERLMENINTLNENINNYKRIIDENKRKEVSSQKLIENLSLQLNELRAEVTKIQDTEKKMIQSTLSNNLGFGIKTIQRLENNNELSLNDEKSVYVFLKLIEEKSLGLDNLLTQYDKDNDLFIFKNEMMNVLEDINLPMEDRAPVINLAGFNKNKMRMPIKTIIDNFYKREEKKNKKLNEILFKLAYILHNKLIGVEKVYDFLKINDDCTLSYKELKQGFNSLEIIITENDCENLFRSFCINDENRISLNEFIDKLKIRKKIIDEIGDIDGKIRFNEKNYHKESNINLSEDKKESTESENSNLILDRNNDNILDYNAIKSNTSHNFDYDKIVLSSNSNRDKEIISEVEDKYKDVELENDSKYNETVKEDGSSVSDGNNENQNIINSYFKNKSTKEPLSINEKSTSKNQSTSNNKIIKQTIDSNQKINGELKIQIKSVENVIIPSSLSKPYSFFLTGSLKGLDMDFNSKDVISDNCKVVNFNWASRILIKNKTLTDIGSLLKLELKIKTNKGTPVPIGESMLNWTATLQPNNLDKFVISDKFQLLSKRMASVGIISIQAKFIPFGSINSLFDKNGKKNKIPNTMKGLINENDLYSSRKQDSFMDGIKTVDHINEVLGQSMPGSVNKENESEPEETIIKSIDVEILNIQDKQYLMKKDNLFLTIEDSENSEIFNSNQKNENFNEILQNLPLNFNINIYSTNKQDKLNFKILIKDKSGVEEITIGQIKLSFDSKQKYLTINDKYPLEVLRKNYFKLNTNKISNNNIIFFMKFSIENQENYIDQSQEKQEEAEEEINSENDKLARNEQLNDDENEQSNNQYDGGNNDDI